VQAPARFREPLLRAIRRLRRCARTLGFEAPAADDLVQTALERALTHRHQLALRMDLVAALERLPVEQREPLLLVSVEQFTYGECAEALGIPIGTVMSRISRARVALRAWLDGRAPAPAAIPSSATSGLRRVL
jgi:RNA polymerase sigma-70 factor (ECF subfamily)